MVFAAKTSAAAIDPSAPAAHTTYSTWGDADAALTKRFGVLANARSLTVWDTYTHSELSLAAFDKLWARHMPKPTGKGSAPPASEVLTKSSTRRELRGLMFWPGAPPMFQYDGAWWGNRFTGSLLDETPMTREAKHVFIAFLRHLFPRGTPRAWLKCKG
jgi:hypothetical protein